MVRVHVVPLGRVITGQKGENLFSVFQRKGIPLESYCGGVGSCGKCVVRILEGMVSPPTDLERAHLGERWEAGFRLACQVTILGDLTCDVSPSLRHALEVLLDGVDRETYDPGDCPVQWKTVSLQKPPLFQVTSLKEELEKALPVSAFSRGALEGLSLLGEEKEGVFEVLWDEEVFAIFPSPQRGYFGVAFDLGTTTVACALLDLGSGRVLAQAGALNRQVRFGADVISRLRAIQDRPDSLSELQHDALSTMNALLQEVCARAGCEQTRIVAATVSGNTIMEHLFLGLSPLSIGVAPYVPVIREGYHLRAKEVGLSVHPEASVYVLPCVAGYVGGDVVGGVGAFRIHDAQKTTLYLDVGTNGEIVLVARGRILACGTAAGPAFEGAEIHFGMRASEGAIASVALADGEVRIRTIGHVPPRGICGTGLIDVLAEFLRVGLLSPTGKFQEDGRWSSFFEGSGAEKRFFLSRNPDVFVTQKDMEKLQLALAAMRAGRNILLKEAGLREEDIEEVVLAGAFGSFIRPESAARIGLIPQNAQARSVGNASLVGARKALLSRRFRGILEDLARRIEYVELSARRDFEEAFCEGLVLPR